jgi:LmbE family N-acetylglucosaminyl deacetylase
MAIAPRADKGCPTDFEPAQRGDLAKRVLEHLRPGVSINIPAVVVVAHPDDETLGMGGRLGVFENLTILQLTDGSPADCADARQLGFCNAAGYAAAREREAVRALAALGVRCRRVCYAVTDQESVFRIPELVQALLGAIRDAKIVFTHPYEGGHPDHDTAALIVQLACEGIRASGGTAPLRLEFASYHHRAGKTVRGEFWTQWDCPEIAINLEADSYALKCRAIEAYPTQSRVISWFNPTLERYRIAPLYDFLRPPPPGTVLYDLFGWPITSILWLKIVAALVTALRGGLGCASSQL